MPVKNNYITAELLWSEEQLVSWKAYIDANPLHTLKDRIQNKTTKTGGVMPMVVSTIEQQIKAISDLMTRYLSLLEVVNRLREAEEQKKEARGSQAVSPFESGQI